MGRRSKEIYCCLDKNQGTKYPARQRALRRKFFTQRRESMKGEKWKVRELSSNGFKSVVLGLPVSATLGNI